LTEKLNGIPDYLPLRKMRVYTYQKR